MFLQNILKDNLTQLSKGSHSHAFKEELESLSAEG